MSSKVVLGLIAGEGRLPALVAEGANRAGLKVICICIVDNADPDLARQVDCFYIAALARPGGWIRRLKRHGATRTVMVGRVAKSKLFTPKRMLHFLPDWRALRIYYWRLRKKDKRNDTLLKATADELASSGIILENSTMYCKEHIATEGVLTRHKPSRSVQQDIEFGWQIARKLGQLDIGQAVAVKEKEVVAVEAIEGTAAMIERAGQFCRAGGWTLVKTSKPNQDMRFDVPCVGPDTIKAMSENGGVCLAVEAEKTIIIDKADTLKLADELGITVVGCPAASQPQSDSPPAGD